jgi:hypothetical protein
METGWTLVALEKVNSSMATWISHLRIAERLLELDFRFRGQPLEPIAFAFGNLAPDSGIYNAELDTFDPPKEITHFADRHQGEHQIRDLEFYRQFIAPHNNFTGLEGSYRLGYYVHLLSDVLSARLLHPATKLENAALFALDKNQAWEAVKGDSYDLDHLYLKRHPKSLFFRSIALHDVPAVTLEIAPRINLEEQSRSIRDFYLNPPERELERTYPYFNEKTAHRFVEDATELIVEVCGRLEEQIPDGDSGLELITPNKLEPYKSPLGDPRSVPPIISPATLS